jgi:hypothetical protein
MRTEVHGTPLRARCIADTPAVSNGFATAGESLQRHLRSTYEIDDQSKDENGSKNAAAEIHELLRWLI